MNNIVDDIKNLINKQIAKERFISSNNLFAGAQKTYLWTNENIYESFNLVDLTKVCRALLVSASGDQAFSLLCHGKKDLALFDINELSEYLVLGLKRSMILKYSYEDFLKIMDKLINEEQDFLFVSEVIWGLLPLMDTKYRVFWQQISDYNYQIQKSGQANFNLLKFLFIGIKDVGFVKKSISYLHDLDSYERLRKNISHSNISFTNCNITNLVDYFSKPYDFIYFSNILDYMQNIWHYGWNLTDLNKFLQSIQSLSHEETILYLQYVFDYASNNLRDIRSTICSQSNLKRSDLPDYNISCVQSIGKNCYDGVVLKRRN